MKKCGLFVIFILVLQSATSMMAQEKNRADDGTFDLNFKGGSLNQYLEMLRTKPNLNNEGEQVFLDIVATLPAGRIRLPEIQLKSNMTGSIGLLNGYKTDEFELSVDFDPSANVRRISVHFAEPVEVTVVNCRQLLKTVSIDDLLEAVNFGLELQGTSVELKLHQKTGLMFVYGTKSSTDLVTKTIKELSAAESTPNPSNLNSIDRGEQSLPPSKSVQRKK